MIKEAIDRIIELARPVEVAVDGLPYTTLKLQPVDEPELAILQVHTLAALCDLLELESDTYNPAEVLVHVKEPTVVAVLARRLTRFGHRHVHALAVAEERSTMEIGEWLPQDEFVLGVQVSFVQDLMTAAVLRVVGNVRDEMVTTAEDDGFTQRVKARAGVALVEDVELPNPVHLRPFRTFPEVEQPASGFVLRARRVEGKLPEFKLQPVDSRWWKVNAVATIREYLTPRLSPLGISIIA